MRLRSLAAAGLTSFVLSAPALAQQQGSPSGSAPHGGMHGPMHGDMKGGMQDGACPMQGQMGAAADVHVENGPDGATLHLTAKDPTDPQQVAQVQQLAQRMQSCMQMHQSGGASDAAPHQH